METRSCLIQPSPSQRYREGYSWAWDLLCSDSLSRQATHERLWQKLYPSETPFALGFCKATEDYRPGVLMPDEVKFPEVEV